MNRKMVDSEMVLKNYEPDFRPMFETRLRARMERIRIEINMVTLNDRIFKRVVYSGLTTIAAILIVIFVLNGSLGYDSLLGVKELSVENSLVLSMAGY